MKPTKHIIIARVDNKPGVVSRIAGLFTRRGYNIDSLVTGTTENPDVYHMTITAIGTKDEMDLLIHQLGRVMEVITVREADSTDYVTRELMLMRIDCEPDMRTEAMKIADVMGLRIAGVTSRGIVIEVTGDDVRLESAVRAFEHIGVASVIRSGAVTIEM
ncbi:MAG: acetolactate synthase small subunit [Eubacteriales bacterium]